MLRVVVPTVYCRRDPLEELFASPYSFHYGMPRSTPRDVPCCSRRHGNSLMPYSTLAAFVEAMEAMNKSEQDCDKKCANCSCKKNTKQATDMPSQPNQEESTIPSSSESVNSEQSSAPSTSGDSEKAKSSEAVTVPINKLVDQSDSDHFQVSLNLKSFKPEDIEVTRVDNELKVHAKEEVERYGMIFHREIHRSYQLPEDVDADSLKSTLSTAGVLTIEAKRRPKPSEEAEQEDKKGQDVNPELVEDRAEDSTTGDQKN
ncbi:uncharacterized protein [Amphiura filiformis]|uniref:uncharacterized protein n=1 Tax=Amphiura filiformis TaxID=82378 RepID=UPI003B212687